MVEVSEERRAEVMGAYRTVGVEAIDIGKVTDDGQVCASFCLLPYIFMGYVGVFCSRLFRDFSDNFLELFR